MSRITDLLFDLSDHCGSAGPLVAGACALVVLGAALYVCVVLS